MYIIKHFHFPVQTFGNKDKQVLHVLYYQDQQVLRILQLEADGVVSM